MLMKATLAAGLLLGAAALTAFSPPPRRTATSPQCAAVLQRYRADVDAASRYAAFNAAAAEHLQGGQQSAAQTRESNAMARSRMSFDAAKGAGCRPVALAPSPEKYEADADMCKVELIGAQWGGHLPQHCDPTGWSKR